MMLSRGDDARRCIMAIAVQQLRPLAPLPLILGGLRRLEVATVLNRLSPPTLRMGARLGVESKPWSWRCWMAIMPSRRWGTGWKTVACWPCSNQGSHAPHAMLLG